MYIWELIGKDKSHEIRTKVKAAQYRKKSYAKKPKKIAPVKGKETK